MWECWRQLSVFDSTRRKNWRKTKITKIITLDGHTTARLVKRSSFFLLLDRYSYVSNSACTWESRSRTNISINTTACVAAVAFIRFHVDFYKVPTAVWSKLSLPFHVACFLKWTIQIDSYVGEYFFYRLNFPHSHRYVKEIKLWLSQKSRKNCTCFVIIFKMFDEVVS